MKFSVKNEYGTIAVPALAMAEDSAPYSNKKHLHPAGNPNALS